jgi:hypothetical protein
MLNPYDAALSVQKSRERDALLLSFFRILNQKENIYECIFQME